MRIICKTLFLLAFLASLALLGFIFASLSLFGSEKVHRFRLSIFSKWCRWILKLFSIQIHENQFQKVLSQRPKVIVANHVSYLDIPILASLEPTLFLAKKEVSQWPLMGLLGKSLGMIFVDRARLSRRVQAISDIQTQIRKGYNVVVFPEGTTSLTGPQKGRVPFYAGAFRVARNESVPLEIVYIEYEDQDCCAWVGSESFVNHLWKFLGTKKVKVKIRREYVLNINFQHAQREVYFESRKWLLEGGHGFVSSFKARPIYVS